MLTYEQKRLFLILVVAIMIVPMILVGMIIRIKKDIHNWKCPAIREVGEFQRVFNEYAAEAGMSIDVGEAQWRESGYYHAKTVPVTGTETSLSCTVVGNYESHSAEVMRVEFHGEFEMETEIKIELLSETLKQCFQIFAPTVYGYYDFMHSYDGDHSYVEILDNAEKTWGQTEAEYFESFFSDDHASENLRIYSCITEDGTYEKGFIWS